ncbi:MAG: hypothetical protein WCL11_27665, partial [Verrucomicrobiota bacterium]
PRNIAYFNRLLDVEGDLPPAFASIRDRLYTQQKASGRRKASVDHIFDLPVELARDLTGYRHDCHIGELRDKPYEVLQTTTATPKRSWLRKVLGV